MDQSVTSCAELEGLNLSALAENFGSVPSTNPAANSSFRGFVALL